MIWIAFALLAVGVTSSIIFLASKAKYWMTALRSDVTTVRKNILGIESTMAGIAAERPLIDHAHESLRVMHETVATLHAALAKPEVKPEPLPPLPACSCGSLDLLTLTGQRTRIVCCQRCGLVFGVDAAGVRFVRHSEAIPEYATQRAARTLAYEEMKHAMDAKRPERPRAREPLGRPIT
jgi:hypothetical protein